MYCMQDKTEVGENMRQEFETKLFHTIDKEKIYVNEKMEKHKEKNCEKFKSKRYIFAQHLE